MHRLRLLCVGAMQAGITLRDDVQNAVKLYDLSFEV
jgi:hypothetical protein